VAILCTAGENLKRAQKFKKKFEDFVEIFCWEKGQDSRQMASPILFNKKRIVLKKKKKKKKKKTDIYMG